MNAALIKDLEKAYSILQDQSVKTDSVTVESEILTSMSHISKAIESEKNKP